MCLNTILGDNKLNDSFEQIKHLLIELYRDLFQP